LNFDERGATGLPKSSTQSLTNYGAGGSSFRTLWFLW